MEEKHIDELRKILNGYHQRLDALGYKAWESRTWADPEETASDEEEIDVDLDDFGFDEAESLAGFADFPDPEADGPEPTRVEAPEVGRVDEETEAAAAGKGRAIDELMALTGLDDIKAEVLRQISYRKIMRLRELEGKRVPGRLLHILLTGRPGTGKTTVARLIARIFHEEGLLKKNVFRETNRAELVGQWLGETEANTSEIIENARGGVLFIDEIYSLTSRGRDDRDFGRHVVDTLMPVLCDDKSDIMVIGAGYPDEMKEFVKSNPGLTSRFPLVLEFADFSEEQLLEIGLNRLAEFDFTLDAGADAAFRRLVADMARVPDAANARVVITTVENYIIPNFSERVTASGDTEAMVAGIITEGDIPALRELSVVKLGADGGKGRSVGFHAR